MCVLRGDLLFGAGEGEPGGIGAEKAELLIGVGIGPRDVFAVPFAVSAGEGEGEVGAEFGIEEDVGADGVADFLDNVDVIESDAADGIAVEDVEAHGASVGEAAGGGWPFAGGRRRRGGRLCRGLRRRV